MEKTYRVTGMTCSGCQNKISKTLNSIDGIRAEINLEEALVKVHSHHEISLDELNSKLKEAGKKTASNLKPDNLQSIANLTRFFACMTILIP